MEKNSFKIGISKVLLILALVVICLLGILVYKTSNNKKVEEDKKSENTTNKVEVQNNNLGDLEYDFIVDDWAQENSNILGGYASTEKAILVNSDKNEMYTIYYSDVWEVHEEKGSKDSVEIEVRNISDKKLSSITSNLSKADSASVKEFLDDHIENDYDIEVFYESIDDIEYDMILKEETSTIKEDITSKTTDGIYAIEYSYELVNSELKKKYNVYVYDLAQEFNNDGEDDEIIVESEIISDEELDSMVSNNDKNSDLENLYDLIKDHINEDFIISVREY